MSSYLRLARFYLLLLGIFTVGRWLMGGFGKPYVKAHHVFSIVILTLLGSLFYGAFCRRWLGYRAAQAVLQGVVLGLMSQVVILLSTLVSYGLGLETFFNHSTALNVTELGDLTESGEPLRLAVSFGDALANRLAGLVSGSIAAGVAGAIGWAMGALLPSKGHDPAPGLEPPEVS